jgi:hypothetical protein
MRDDDDDEIFDEKNWSAKRMALATIAGPLNGIPFVGEMIEAAAGKAFGVQMPSGNLLDGGAKAVGAFMGWLAG